MVSNMNTRHNMSAFEGGATARNEAGGAMPACEEMLRAIDEADFFANDLKLYLDTHPDDERALEMYLEAVKQYKACKAAFEESFYPLCAYDAGMSGEWDWTCGNFPPK